MMEENFAKSYTKEELDNAVNDAYKKAAKIVRASKCGKTESGFLTARNEWLDHVASLIEENYA